MKLFDIDQVTMAPWHQGENTDGQFNVYAGEGIDVTPSWAIPGTGRPMSQDDCLFIAAARNAFEFMRAIECFPVPVKTGWSGPPTPRT